MSKFRVAAVAALLFAAPPLAAQTPFTPPSSPTIEDAGGKPHFGKRHRRGKMFASMSDAGRATMRDAMRSVDRRDNRAEVKAARDRMLAVLEAERLDTAALKRAMDAERDAAEAKRAEHHAAMAAGFARLSLADRRAYVADARAWREHAGKRAEAWRERRGARGMASPPEAN